jgi:hypothetical protein
VCGRPFCSCLPVLQELGAQHRAMGWSANWPLSSDRRIPLHRPRHELASFDSSDRSSTNARQTTHPSKPGEQCEPHQRAREHPRQLCQQHAGLINRECPLGADRLCKGGRVRGTGKRSAGQHPWLWGRGGFSPQSLQAIAPGNTADAVPPVWARRSAGRGLMRSGSTKSPSIERQDASAEVNGLNERPGSLPAASRAS